MCVLYPSAIYQVVKLDELWHAVWPGAKAEIGWKCVILYEVVPYRSKVGHDEYVTS